uniref:Uncharacterized protein n=1 Tax=Ralstonia pickettii (strain 12J) TaxID=402626 RepID=B2UGA3_RALPJ
MPDPTWFPKDAAAGRTGAAFEQQVSTAARDQGNPPPSHNRIM